jgi:hypothetical protein
MSLVQPLTFNPTGDASMNTDQPQTVLPPAMSSSVALQEADRIGADLARLLAHLSVTERGSTLARVLNRAFVPAPPPSPDTVPEGLLDGFKDNFPEKQVFSKAFKEWALANLNMAEVEAEFREARISGVTFDELYPELEKLAKSHE